MLSSLALWCLAATALAVAALTLALGRAVRATVRPQEDLAELPALTVIRPVRGVDVGLDENVRAALRQAYPGALETLFVVDDAREPALPVIERAIADEHADARIVIAGPAPPRRTGKLHAMIRGLEEARGHTELVCFADSDTRPGPTVLRELVETLVAHPCAGSAFARAIGALSPRTLGDAVYALLLDGIYGPQAALAMQRRGSLPFIMGQTMVLRRNALESCGGLEASEGELVDDMNIGARLARAGWRNLLVATPLPIVQEGATWSELSTTAIRWIAYGRTGIPFWPFNLPATLWTALYVVGVAGASIALALRDPTALACFVVSSSSVATAIEGLRRAQGGPPLPIRLWGAPFVCLAMLPWWFVRARFTRAIVWRGRTYRLRGDGRLGGGAPHPVVLEP